MSIFIKPFMVLLCCLFIFAGGAAAQEATVIKPSNQPKNDSLIMDSLRNLKQLIYFNTPKKLSTTSSAMVLGKEFSSTPVFAYPLAVAGRLAGLSVSQGNGEPLNEGFSYRLRGQSPLVFIDGIPRSVTEISMEEIESVTVLKDAVALAMLGVRGSGGAISIVTKKGNPGKQQISFTGQWGVQKPLQNLISNPLDAYNYAQLYNEALVNDGLSVVNNGFNEAALNGFQSGSNPYLYPNVDWRDQVLKNSATIARYNLNTSGGNNYVKYFINLEHVNQDGFFKTSDLNSNYSTNAGAKGYFIRSNIDVNLTEKISAGIYIQGRILNKNNPGNAAADNIFTSLLNTPNSAYPVYNANGTYGGSTQFTNNILAQSISSGYSLSNTRTVLTDVYLKHTLDDLTKGLWVKVRASFFSNLNENLVRVKSFAVFEPNGVSGTGSTTYRQFGTNSEQGNNNSISFQNRSDFQEFSIGYNRTINKHGFDAVILANRDNLVNGTNLPYTIQGISGHLAYNYDEKYLAEVSFAQNGANRYPNNGGFRYGFFPAAGLGWNINKEAFLKDLSWLNNLKLYTSYGKSGKNNTAYYTYMQVYNASPTSYFGSSAAAGSTIGESYLANPNITWEKAKIFNAGVDGTLFKNQLSFNVEYYSNEYSDLSIVRGNNTGLLGISYPEENIGKQRYYGVDAQINWSQKYNDFGYFISANASLQNSKLLYSAEANQRYAWMYRTGHPVGQNYGYIAEGLFQNQQEIIGYPTIEGYTPQPGDIKYRDLNGDGVINQFDQTTFGSEKAAVFLGSRIGFSFKGVDFSALFQGVLNQQVYLSGNSYREFQGGTAQAYETQLGRWTPATAATATYPRLTTSSGPRNGAQNNFVSSSYWLRSGNYIRLKTIELGYTIPAAATKKIGLKSTRIFLNGLNLYTWSSDTFNGADPENYTGAYPIGKVFNVGVNIQL